MKFGCVFPTCEIGNDPAFIRDFAQTAEDLGYTHIVAYDHVLGAEHANRNPKLWGPYDETHPFHEPIVLFSYLAGITTRIELVTGVLILPQRQTALVAKQAVELAILSENRFRLGVGVGWNYVEYQSLGKPFHDRGRLLDEQIEILQALWNEDLVIIDTEFHNIDRAGIKPRRSVPLWFGGRNLRSVKRAAKHGEGFIFGSSDSSSKNLMRQLLEELNSNGRRNEFGIDVLIGFGDGPDHWHQEVKNWKELGASTLSMRAMSSTSAWSKEADPAFTKPQQHIDALETFIKEVNSAV